MKTTFLFILSLFFSNITAQNIYTTEETKHDLHDSQPIPQEQQSTDSLSNEKFNTAIELLNDKEALNKITKEGAKKGEKTMNNFKKNIQSNEI